MTKQEEIRKGMEQIVSDMVYGVGAYYSSKEIVARLQEFEDSQGVVIKVECDRCKGRGTVLFLYPRIGPAPGNMLINCEKCDGVGYEAVEPLI